MIRLTRKVFTDLTIWMIGLGLLMGLVFPFFVVLMGIPAQAVLTPWFFAACMAAGLIVGAANVRLARVVVGRRLRILAEHMHHVANNLQEVADGSDLSRCNPDGCLLTVDSEDEIGESAQAFNHLVGTLALSLQTEAAVRTFTEMLASQLDVSDLTDRALHQLLEHTHAGAGAILVETEGEARIAVAHGIRSASAILTSDYVRQALRTEKRQSVLLPEDIVVEGVLTDFRPARCSSTRSSTRKWCWGRSSWPAAVVSPARTGIAWIYSGTGWRWHYIMRCCTIAWSAWQPLTR